MAELETLGHGTYGTVYAYGEDRVIKCARVPTARSRSLLDQTRVTSAKQVNEKYLKREAVVLDYVRTACALRKWQYPETLVHLYWIHQPSGYGPGVVPAGLVLSRGPSQTLAEYLERQELQCGLSGPAGVVVALQLTSALAFLHALRVVHLDVKPENILLCPQTMRIMLIDFGLAQCLSDAEAEIVGSMLPGSPIYMPPEYFGLPSAVPVVGRRADIWSTALTLWIALAGRHPYMDKCKDVAQLKAYLARHYALEVPATLGGPVAWRIVPLLQAMLNPQPLRRPAMSDAQKGFQATWDAEYKCLYQQ